MVLRHYPKKNQGIPGHQGDDADGLLERDRRLASIARQLHEAQGCVERHAEWHDVGRAAFLPRACGGRQGGEGGDAAGDGHGRVEARDFVFPET